MVSIHFCVIGLAVLVFPQSVSTGDVVQGKRDDFQPLNTTVYNIERKLENHAAILTEMRSELAMLKAKRCETGQVYFTPHDKPVVILPDGKLSRSHKIYVRFTRPFSTTPWVSVGFSKLDVYNTANLRIDGSAQAVTTSGFDAITFEWANTYIFQARISWVACNV